MKHEPEPPKKQEHQSPFERIAEERGVEPGADMAPHQNRPPAVQHRGGPLPNQKK
ncbi:MAG TPA: hypothetical protein VFE17_00895 [Candidatus Baltobacteraceae bacterium]|nr:hypothetical protein [Candidatus Baltobacteraceae bacterium]